MKILVNKNILITGGTGSFGNALTKKIITDKIKINKLVVFSRDEKKQFDMRNLFKDSNLKIDFIIGDVRDESALDFATRNIDFIFHAAALKQVPSCEFYPLEAVKTNVLGTENLIKSSIKNNVLKLICLSTDKAVYPINAMGISKALMEKIAISKSLLKQNKTIVCVTRYGNVMGSRGSVIPLMIDQIKKNEPITITNPNMTRFLMSLDDAMDLVLYAFKNGKNGQLFVKKTHSSTVLDLAKAIMLIFKKPNHPMQIIGTRHGEKHHETLLSAEEKIKAIENTSYFIINPDIRDLNYKKFYTEGVKKVIEKSYTSDNCELLKVNEIVHKLLKLDFIN
jgi:UDP-N-acetylglucosamine 4,6-dehydratase